MGTRWSGEFDEELESRKSRYGDVFRKLAEDRKIFLTEEINKEIASAISALMLLLAAEDKEKPIDFYINSVGGEIEGLFAIYDTMQIIQPPIRTICIGEASSSAAIILASGSLGMRLATPNSQIMIHQVRGGVDGTGTDIEVEAKAIKQTKKRLTELLAKHTGQAYRKVYRDCEVDKYMSAEEALKYGLIDEVMPFVKAIPDLKGQRKSKNNPS